VKIYVKQFFDFHILFIFWLSITILLMTSQIRSHIGYLMQNL